MGAPGAVDDRHSFLSTRPSAPRRCLSRLRPRADLQSRSRTPFAKLLKPPQQFEAETDTCWSVTSCLAVQD